jgi:hypothetical protein
MGHLGVNLNSGLRTDNRCQPSISSVSKSGVLEAIDAQWPGWWRFPGLDVVFHLGSIFVRISPRRWRIRRSEHHDNRQAKQTDPGQNDLF